MDKKDLRKRLKELQQLIKDNPTAKNWQYELERVRKELYGHP